VKDTATTEAGTTYKTTVGDNAIIDVGAALSGKAKSGSFKIDAAKGYTQKIGGGLTMQSHSLNVFGSDSTSISTEGALTFLSLILVRLGVGVYQAKAPLFGLKMLLAQLTDGGDKLTVGGKIVTFDGLKLAFKSITNKLKATLVLVKAGKIHLNVGGPPAPESVKTPLPGFLAKIKAALVDLRKNLEKISSTIAAALQKLPSQIRSQVQNLLAKSLGKFFGQFLPPVWANAFSDLFSGKGITGPLGDLLNDLNKPDYDKELADGRPAPGAGGTTTPGAPGGAGPGGGPANLTPGASWIEVKVLDTEGEAIPNVAFVVKAPDGSSVPGTTGADGSAQVEVPTEGTCEVTFPDLESWQLA
jgi:hypothetical protein